MNPGDRRLLIELAAILAIKLAIIVLLKLVFFSPAPMDRRHPLTVEAPQTMDATRFFRAATSHPSRSADKER